MLQFQFFNHTLRQSKTSLKLSQAELGYDPKIHSKSFSSRTYSNQSNGTVIVYLLILIY